MPGPRPLPQRRGPRSALLTALVLLLVSAPATAAPRDDGVLLVQIAEGAAPSDLRLGRGATIEWRDADAGLLAIRGGDADALRRDPRVLSVEPDGRVRAAGVSWDGVSWDRASWDGASWDRASWDGASWDRASWDGASWDGEGDGEPRATWALDAIRAPEAWENGDAPHARLVCIVDSGVDLSHPLLAPNLAPVGLDLVRGDATPDDEAGHGTHLAGIVAAVRDEATGFRGVGAPLVASVKVLSADGTGLTSDVIAGLRWCREHGADVVLLALTEDAPTRALHAAVREARRSGALVVASAGNGGCDRCVSKPGAYPEALAVAAIGPDGRVAAFSSTGPQVALAAPGASILSAFPGNTMRVGSGTSQAAAHVAGAAALLLAQNPGWSAGDVERALLRHAAEADRPGRDSATGHGTLDVGAASARSAS